jgi:hypothetical protein
MRKSFYTCFDVWVTIVIENLHSDCKMMKYNKWHLPFLIFIYTKNLIQIHQNLCLSVIHHKSLFTDFLLHLEGYSLKLCMLTYCFMEKCMSLHHFLWQFIFLFWLRILYKKCVGRLGESIRFLSRTDYNYLLCFLKIACKLL